jgi:hypothetical protein
MNVNQLIRELSNCSYNINHHVNKPVNIERGIEIIDILNIKLNKLLYIYITYPHSLWLTHYPDYPLNAPDNKLFALIPNVILNGKLFNRIKLAVLNIRPIINLNWDNIEYNIGFGIYSNHLDYLELNLYFDRFLFPYDLSATDAIKIAYPLVGIWDVKGSINYIKPHKKGYCEGNDILSRVETRKPDTGRIAITNLDISGSGIAICVDDRIPDRPRICIVQILIINENEINKFYLDIARIALRGKDINDTNILFHILEYSCPSIITLKDAENGWLYEQLIKI